MSARKRNRAQSTAEYVVVLGLMVGVVIAMQTYVKRSLQGRIRDVTDTVDNEAAVPGANDTPDNLRVVPSFQPGRQYEPYYLSSKFDTQRESEETEAMALGGKVDRNLKKDEKVTQDQGGYQHAAVPVNQTY